MSDKQNCFCGGRLIAAGTVCRREKCLIYPDDGLLTRERSELARIERHVYGGIYEPYYTPNKPSGGQQK